MALDFLHYVSGEDVHTGDRIQYQGVFATVVFVNHGETEEYSPGYEDYIGSERGLIICDDDGGITSIGEPDGQVEFVDRG
jgi:hypothetical protein